MAQKDTDPYDLVEEGDAARTAGQFTRAGEFYARAAHGHLAREEKSTPLSQAIVQFARAGLSFRAADHLERCRTQCRHGVVLAEDIRDRVFQRTPYRALTWEIVGDYRQIGDIAGADDAYDTARELYGEVPDGASMKFQNQELFESQTFLIVEFAEEVGEPISVDKQHEMLESFETRLTTKRDRLADSLELLDDRGEW